MRGRGLALALVGFGAALAVLVFGAPGALAATPFVDIASTGPLEHVYLGQELSCQIDHTSDFALEFYPPSTIPGDCGTFVAIDGVLFAPNLLNHGGTATGGLGAYTPFTPVSQSSITGSGTSADPFIVVTMVDVGQTGLRIMQTDFYVVGDEAYRTDIALVSMGPAVSGVLYRAGDCFLGGSDTGYGFTEIFGDRKAVGCSVNQNNMPPGRIEEWVPLTGGNNYFQAFYSSVWNSIGTKTSFPDTCGCTLLQDNGAGISWPFSLPAGGSATFSHATTFSPTGRQALEIVKSADSPTSEANSQNGYAITVSNPNANAVTLVSIQDSLPPGFAYVAGSTSGVTMGDPSVSGQLLTWSGPFSVPASSSVSLHFLVTVGATPGDYFNEARGEAANGFTVLPTGPTARVTVSQPQAGLETSKVADSPTSEISTQNGYTITIVNPNPDAVTLVSIQDSLPPGFAYVAGSTSGAAMGDPSVSGQLLTWSGPFSVPGTGSPGGSSISLHFLVTVAGTPGEYFNDAGAEAADGFSVVPTGPTAPIRVTQPLETSKAADSATSVVNAQSGYTITIVNPNPDPVTLLSIHDTLPPGFSYMAGSTSGAAMGEPGVSGQLLTWSGPVSVPGTGSPGGSSISLHFLVTVAGTPGEYFNDAGAEAADPYSVIPTGPTARITVAEDASRPPGPPQGCTPGYWKNHEEAWQRYTTTTLVGNVFAIPPGLAPLPDDTLIEALHYDGGRDSAGMARNLLRSAVAALLNAAHAEVNYPMTSSEVIQRVDEALASGDRDTMRALHERLDELNNAGCPLG